MNCPAFFPLAALAVLMLAGCASAPASTPATSALMADVPAECPPRQAGLDPVAELAEANRLIAEAGEHPSDAQLASLLPRL